MGPLISIVIPVYNAAAFISKCLNSIKDQTYTKVLSAQFFNNTNNL